MWTNPFDRVPQVPQDWANHVIYGAGLGFAVQVTGGPPSLAVGVVLMIAAAKKVVDFFKEHESAAVCIGKTVVTAAIPLAELAVNSLRA